MWKSPWKRGLQIAVGSVVLTLASGCVSSFAPLVVSLGESALMTYLFGRGP